MTPVELFDRVVREVAGVPVRVRVALTLPLAVGWAERARVVVPGVVVAGLRLRDVDARATGVRVVPGVPPRLRVERLDVRVRVDEAALDDWARSVALPVRLRLRPGAVEATAGLAGFRVGGVEVDVAVDDRGRLRLSPLRVSVLGVGLASGALPPFALPLPPLPRRARLRALEPGDGIVATTFELAAIDEPLTPSRLAELARSWRSLVARPARPAPPIATALPVATRGAHP